MVVGHQPRLHLLCRDADRYVVVEINRDVVDQRTIGQVLGYMGWVESNLEAPAEQVRGIMVGHRPDAHFRYAVGYLSNVDFVALERIERKLGLALWP